MPKNQNIKKVLVLGSGPIVIGQAAEFDYAGTQACRALKEEGVEVVLVNSNPATIMTDKDIADHVYIEPLNIASVTQVIQIERPDSILPTLGGQTGLNLAMNLHEQGILEEYNVRLLGTSPESIRKAEDRQGFKDAMEELGQPCVTSDVVESVEDAVGFANSIGYPVIVRPAYTLGGTGGGIAYDEPSLREIADRGIHMSRVGQVLIERSIAGWKEIEFEVMRDSAGNVIQICSMENIDPVGVHTGDSIVVAPTQTLANKEYQMLRTASLDIISALRIEGGCNVQLALNPDSYEYAVIEVNPRVSRSSALASKATGYPIAKVAAKIALGYTLDEIPNAVTGKTTACFEPTLDYCVLKIPRLPFDKFTTASRTLGTQMKATGEVMAIGNSFEGALMKAIRSLELPVKSLRLDGLDELYTEEIEERLANVDDQRLFVVAEALRRGFSPEKINKITQMDIWFLDRFQNIVDMEDRLERGHLDRDTLYLAKEMGFSDAWIAALSGKTAAAIKALRGELGIVPSFKMVDTCAAEFEAQTPYYYSTYDAENEAVQPHEWGDAPVCETLRAAEAHGYAPDPEKKKVLVLGSGPIRIGQGIEFDYCSVHSVWAFRRMGYETIIINNNPETVSTDFDVADKLYFEPLTPEDVENVVELEKPWGAVVQFGGQTAIKLAKALTDMGVPILGTSSDGVDAAEDRERFDEILQQCGIPRAAGKTVFTTEEALAAANEVGYPVLVRPSYVLGGQGMEIAYHDRNITEFMRIINQTVQEHPILVDKYLMGREVEVDGVFDGEDILIPGIMEHVERAGVHSGDSISVYPPLHIEDQHKETILRYTYELAKALGVIGLINIQFILYNDQVYVIEVNPRSSRTIPYISKVTGVPIIDLATKVMLGEKLKDLGFGTGIYPEAPYFAVKMPVFSFEKLTDVDTGLGPEMKSTGEVLGIAESFPQALLKAFKGANMKVPKKGGRVIVTVKDEDKGEMVGIARGLEEMGIEILATSGTCDALNAAGVPSRKVARVSQAHPNILDMIASGSVDLVINTPTRGRKHDTDGFKIRRAAVEHSVACVTAIDTAHAILTVREQGRSADLRPIDITKI
ncbi:carbamoyl-phosphate synthase large subunit [Intestinimonas butyriciproducens]|uniref:Carbamoyl phosphate synthase large chain n=1 Tax=Intestinimonas butyriciproducens TaxID=1297617 RepID=A0A2U1CCT6_9FIRM|nr:carbamoyl-phosphate synthase large subunit [Intestinimonas butyriciproducens]MBU5229635.1 carbamoyl-phosphate synthase large subunit [Intestinimonas butyriciproducens]MCI6363251.1 carbamoyl-phosphate synthase large subunit [Intestinimonas butyriciproducens]MCR1906084.1 carbamoyl-phosphate synthase large subunit [Intestinimonas butyriciproducens]MDY3616099.1 carbamoyl-phosphate synthase large subunit [Intestinimonas butyriciproducens]PVY58607.1 carbamoyl-phosphate synthase large subunit [Int